MQRVQPGQRLNIKARDWNSLIDTAEAHSRSGRSGGQPIQSKLPAGCVWGYNNSATTLEQWTVCTTAAPPGGNPIDRDDYVNTPVATVRYGTIRECHPHRWGIVQEPIEPGGVGVVMVWGVSVVKITDTYNLGIGFDRAWIEAEHLSTVPPVVSGYRWGNMMLVDVVREDSDGGLYARVRFPVDVGIMSGTVTATGVNIGNGKVIQPVGWTAFASSTPVHVMQLGLQFTVIGERP